LKFRTPQEHHGNVIEQLGDALMKIFNSGEPALKRNQRKKTNICVIESKWWGETNTSVRGMFDLLADLHTGTPHGYEYEMSNSRAGFVEALERQLKSDDSNYIAIAAHGTRQGLKLFNEDGVSKTVIRNILKNDDPPVGRNVIGMHLGCCSFLNRHSIEFLNREDISPWWIAGYYKEVDWVESAALDLIFFNKLLSIDNDARANPTTTIRNVASKIARECSGLVKRLGFQIYLLEPGYEVQELI
jgi:hypothetical protein